MFEYSKFICEIICDVFIFCVFLQQGRKDVLYCVCRNNCYQYLRLIVKYREKNSKMISKSINYQSASSREPPLMALLNSKHCTKEWIQLFISLDDGNGNCTIDLSLSVSGVGGAQSVNCIQCCKNQQQLEWESLLVDYAKKTRQKFAS